MSLFDEIPSGFPIDIDLEKRPVSYQLKLETSEAFIIFALGLMWMFVAPLVIYIFFDEFIHDWLSHPTTTWALMAVCAAYVAWAFYVFGQKTIDSFRTVDVTITDTNVQVIKRNPLQKSSWSATIDSFEGVALLNLGTQLVGNNMRPIASVVLKYSDPSKSVPVVYREQTQLGQKTAQKIASQTGLLAISGMIELFDDPNHPPETIVANDYQSMKTKLVYWVILAGASLGLFTAGYYLIYREPDDEIYLVIALCLITMYAMHLYASRYVSHLSETDDGIEITTISLLRSKHNIAWEQIRRTVAREGRFYTHKQIIHTPYVKLRVAGYFLPFIIDMQSEFVAQNKLSNLANHARHPKTN